jgi:hypothetical protein
VLVTSAGGGAFVAGGRVKPLRVDVAGGDRVCEESGDEVRSGNAEDPLFEQATPKGTTANARTSAARSARLSVVIRPSSEARHRERFVVG